MFRSTGKTAKNPKAREKDDFYPTPPEPTRALLAVEGQRLRQLGAVWEPACGDGAMAREIEAFGLPVIASDMVDRGWPGATIRSFYDYDTAQAKAMVTNPPYKEINARDGQGRWLSHALNIGCDYLAMLLNWDWPAAAGLAPLLARHPISRVYVCRWKIDFTGDGAPPQRNAWFIWDRALSEQETVLRFLDRKDGRQGELL
ncbi:hypothetical protein [Thalassovita litoralis]|uniref:hypothetical protein n=1 Tax=Thalassovita litoralis TaxID=1010611 RepID=UPI001C8F2575|nr:hypothetical protein [Thalassovita litoralis]